MTARVLVVDDLRPNVKLLEAKLTSEYFDVITASDGPSALEAVETHDPDIVLLDVMMPGMDGFEVCEILKNDPDTMHIPVVMVTALSDSADRVRGLECGADDFLTKPVNDKALFARVRSLVRLKMLNDEWRLREETSDQLGVLRDRKLVNTVDVKNASVLVIDDSQVERVKVLETLSKDDDNVVSSGTLAEAEEAIKDQVFELVIINLHMRNEDSLRFASHLRAREDTRNIPILMIAEEDDTERLAKGLDLGINDYVVKPVDRNELLARSRTQIRRQRYQERLRDNYERSLAMALTDALTGLYNRRYVTAHLGGMVEKHLATDKPMTLAVFDIDFFKGVNDTFGHQAGDEVLVELSNRIVNGLRNVDMVARMGGEEFVVVMPETEFEIGSAVADRLRNSICEHLFKIAEREKGIRVSISMGLTQLEKDGDEPDKLFKRADAALYFAKAQGRNTVVAAVPTGFDMVGKGDPAIRYENADQD
ncbi:PleD family two-component system response regulator [Curvivirga aplysinae]|uniref:PleD family two-component system response regulator n=1 Tax=Curvivirga aplysinae TaxID=2529852 RepID=UPI0012BCDBA9|nr:PleD family two-component system response regulator [Curvivirga aplysinae]MTI10325.1 PleD family two-component system response regulator [Curvivirga aplysinae]